jgi:alkylhydroperoxidase family enzyme
MDPETEVWKMARIPLDTEHGLLARLAAWYSRRRFGTVLEPLAATAHHPGVLLVGVRLELGVSRRWRRLDPTLQCLAVMAAAARIGCSWCMDFGYWEFHHRGVDPARIEEVPGWRDSGVYTELERMVLEYAEAMTDTPLAVTDEMVARLRERLGDARLVELTALVSLENMRSRTNAALGLQSQGFKAACDLPAASPSSVA